MQELFTFFAECNAREQNYENEDECVNNVLYAFVEQVVDVVQCETVKPLEDVKFESAHVNECQSNFYYSESSEINLHVEPVIIVLDTVRQVDA